MSDGSRYGSDAFTQLELREHWRMANPPSVPAPAIAPKTPTCAYCGQPLDAPHANCPFCPERKENQESPDNGGNEPLKPSMRGVFEDEP